MLKKKKRDSHCVNKALLTVITVCMPVSSSPPNTHPQIICACVHMRVHTHTHTHTVFVNPRPCPNAAAAKLLQSCPTLRPHRRQPTRLPHPCDSPGKNTGVGCHLLLQCMKVKSESEVAQSCLTLSDPMDCSLPGSSVHGIFQAKVLEWCAIAFSEAMP